MCTGGLFTCGSAIYGNLMLIGKVIFKEIAKHWGKCGIVQSTEHREMQMKWKLFNLKE